MKIEQPKISRTCKICENSYESSKDLKRHFSSVHEKIKPKPLPCPKESVNQHFVTWLRLHMEAVHKSKKPYH